MGGWEADGVEEGLDFQEVGIEGEAVVKGDGEELCLDGNVLEGGVGRDPDGDAQIHAM